MSRSKNALILFLFLCLSSDALAQYTFLRKGQTSSYDSSVNIEVKEYRKIRAKILTADTLVTALNDEIKKSYVISSRKDTVISSQILIIESNARVIEVKTKTISDLSDNFNKLFQANNKKKKFYERPGFLFGSGGVAGIIIKTLLAK
jgi:hypothetical protein